ncbi:MAG: DUF1493 family protein [Flavobacteriales bacterium]
MITTETIIQFVSEFTGSKKVGPETDIFNDLGCVGDDFSELMEKFADKFSVDMSGFIWFFHSEDEGNPGIGQWIIKPPYSRVDRIPVTPNLLKEFANSGKWNIDYPPHDVPIERWDIRINQIFGILIVIGIVIYLLLK